MTVRLTPEQGAILKELKERGQELDIQELARLSGVDQSKVAAAISAWSSQFWAAVREESREEILPGSDFDTLVEKGLPERRLVAALGDRLEVSMADAAALSASLGIEMGDTLKFGTRKGWIKIEKGVLKVLRPSGGGPDEDEKVLSALRAGRIRFLDEAPALGIDPSRARNILQNRSSAVKLKPRSVRLVSLTEEGAAALERASVAEARSQLTSEEIVSGAWRDIELKPFDVTLKAEELHPAKPHPMARIIEETRRAFLSMGFTEIASPQAESAFWDFDALFQPQDHPARDMQDTFYLATPREARLPAPDVVERVKRSHEDGGGTGSTGWGYRWKPEEARRMVLRTHATAATVRALSEHPEPPLKVFCVGKVYRNEAPSYKHLPEFYQIDGIVIDEKASFAVLLGLLREFYRRMGIETIRFKPSFFPYTEPSAEVYGFLPRIGRFIELGGAGVFRPEVTGPLGCRVPVLAWGQGLDRLAMARFDLTDIRNLYRSELDWLRRVPLCR